MTELLFKKEVKEVTVCRVTIYLNEALHQISFIRNLRNIQLTVYKSGLLNVVSIRKYIDDLNFDIKNHSFFRSCCWQEY